VKGFLALLLGSGVGLVVGVMIGALIVMGFGYFESGGTQIPFNLQHNALAGKVNVLVDGKTTELKHLLSTLAPFYPQDIKNIARFAKSTGSLPMSVWGFVQSGNVQVCMTIIGPPNNNYSDVYILEFGRLTFSAVHIAGLVTLDWIAGSQDGYVLRDVVYP
jgi:hypothetical protein